MTIYFQNFCIGFCNRRKPATLMLTTQSTSSSSSSSSSSSQRCRWLLFFVTTTLVIMMTSLSGAQSSAILPPHLLLKSEPSNVVDGGLRVAGGVGGIVAGKPGKPKKTGRTGPQSVRPVPSDDLPVLPIRYPESKDTLPSPSDRDPGALASILGSDFDAAFMSIKRPAESYRHPNGTYVYERPTIGTLAQSMKLVGFTVPGRRPKRLEIRSKKKRQMLQKYLAAYTYCPVHYKWIDLGQRFWPRWFRQGDCAGDERDDRSCSFPPGMSCKSQKSTSKTLLWWHCQVKGQCQWIQIKFPVITTCKCSC